MPKNNYRVEIKMSREMKNSLERLRAEYTKQTEEKISMNELLCMIVELYIEKYSY